ncbi:MAG: exodeoxyribonuclease VII large subunit, partial [Pseudomonadota bacterium]|nr:exodeoxyribonuclease VII large subunit [Pseudomonadota bacterium]
SVRNYLSSFSVTFTNHHKRLSQHLPKSHLQKKSIQFDGIYKRLWAKIPELLQHRRSQLESKVFTLQALSPLQTLARGFATLQIAGEDKIVSSVNQIKLDDELQANLQDGSLFCKINKIKRNTND